MEKGGSEALGDGKGNTPLKPRKFAISALLRVFAYLLRYRARVAASLAAIGLAAGTILFLGYGLKNLVDQGFSRGQADYLNHSLLVLMIAVGLLSFASYARFYLVSWIAERVTADLRRDIYRRLVHLDVAFFEAHPVGDLLTRLTADMTLLQTVISQSAPFALRHCLTLAGGIVMLLVTSPRLTGFVLVFVPLVMAPIVLFGRRVRARSRKAQDGVGDVGARMDETLHAIRTVQAFNGQERACTAFGRESEAARDKAMSYVRLRAALTAFVIFVVFGAIGVVLWLGGHKVLSGDLSAGALSSFVFYSILVAGAVGALSEIAGAFQRAGGAAERIFEILDTWPSVVSPSDPVSLPVPLAGRVEFADVGFSYPARTSVQALARFSLALNPGQTVALVGASGAGKSTVAQLLLRFYDPQSGAIRIDGVDIRRLALHDLRRHVGYIAQEPAIFSGSIADNIRIGNPDAPMEAVVEAARRAYADGFISQLPEGYETQLGERGVQLSGGQRQRLSLARVFLKKPEILILDEATSALDAESEKAVQDALKDLMRGRTCLIIAHRLSTIQGADRIVVMDGGRIVEEGAHAELIRHPGGVYARLVALQTRAA